MFNQNNNYQSFEDQEALENRKEQEPNLPFEMEASVHSPIAQTAPIAQVAPVAQVAPIATQQVSGNTQNDFAKPNNLNQVNRSNRNHGPIEFTIHQHLGSLTTNKSGWKREVNVVSWNGKQARLDIRDWQPDHQKMGRGIGLNRLEAENLLALLREKDIQSLGI